MDKQTTTKKNENHTEAFRRKKIQVIWLKLINIGFNSHFG